ncbi:hypothetical protein GDO81_007201 [Engystomops pustulosus]|uniref:Lysophospholipid acyltransferase 2 n=1 Tax=Engystomops pustulosus TaxID=76066 RepID=A0AAV7C764_ENGPU|nr:hypothetical protein GDO81_007201 [Engystomops pustulosus]
MFIDNWNIQTALWLKRVCYERATDNPTALTFLLSAVWHGVYPGYYLTFFTGSLMTLAARNIRSNVRHHFLQSPELKLIYDVMTWIATQVAISYTVAPFVLLSVKPSLQFYSSWYYCLHILCVLVLLLMPARARKKERTDKESIAPPPENVKKDEKTSEHNSHAATNNNSSQREETAWRRPSAPQ